MKMMGRVGFQVFVDDLGVPVMKRCFDPLLRSQVLVDGLGKFELCLGNTSQVVFCKVWGAVSALVPASMKPKCPAWQCEHAAGTGRLAQLLRKRLNIIKAAISFENRVTDANGTDSAAVHQ